MKICFIFQGVKEITSNDANIWNSIISPQGTDYSNCIDIHVLQQKDSNQTFTKMLTNLKWRSAYILFQLHDIV